MKTAQGDGLGSPPHNVKADIVWPGITATVVMLLWAWWFDRHRVLREYARG